ncbi:unnamed protein product [Calicophoron daubneyi]|uniref:Uncharacterized protein n=1 Tax=Calicophoron daubneyi TaxID=300641 RepID=A0AAV2SXT4_CALDB
MFFGNRTPVSQQDLARYFDNVGQPNNAFYAVEPKDFEVPYPSTLVNNQDGVGVPDFENRVEHPEKRKSHPMDSVPGAEEGAPPRKMYLTEAAMSSHFAQMNLTALGHCEDTVLASRSQRSSSAPEMMESNAVRPEYTVVEPDSDESDNDKEDSNSLFKLSDDLKDKLGQMDPNYSVTKLIREMLSPKPSLAIVPYNPELVPPTFKEKIKEESNQSARSSSSASTMEFEPEARVQAPPVPVATDTIPNVGWQSSLQTAPNWPPLASPVGMWTQPTTVSSPLTPVSTSPRNPFSFPFSGLNSRNIAYPSFPSFATNQPQPNGFNFRLS